MDWYGKILAVVSKEISDKEAIDRIMSEVEDVVYEVRADVRFEEMMNETVCHHED